MLETEKVENHKMRLTSGQLTKLNTEGYIIADCPFPRYLTDACLAAVEKVAVQPDQLSHDAKKNHYSLAPQIADSYWSKLDHSLPFLQVILHPQCLELAKQYLGTDDIYLRNAGINENAPGYSVRWHRDSVGQFWNGVK